MLKEDLIALLNAIPDGSDVRIEQPTHDYWKTHLAIEITSLDEVRVAATAYHNNLDAIVDDDDSDEDNPDQYNVYVLC